MHLALLPIGGAGEVRTLCGALLPLDQVETLTPGQGMPCTSCLLSPHVGENMPALSTENPGPALSPQASTDLTPQRAAAQYQSWGWPVTLRADQVCLGLDQNTVALIIPVPLATQLAEILRQRRCPPPVLRHPYSPEHHVLLAGERSGLELPWPPGVHEVTGALFLPPTTTVRGPITWRHPPQPHALQLCRELDVITAIRAVQRSSPRT